MRHELINHLINLSLEEQERRSWLWLASTSLKGG